jgi:phosphate acetyltransferase
MLIPIGSNAGLTSVSLGLVRALQQRGLNVNFFKPIAQPRRGDDTIDKATSILRNMGFTKMATPLSSAHAEELIGDDKKDELLEEIVEMYQAQAKGQDLVIIEGLISTTDHPYAVKVNRDICNALDAKIILVGALGASSMDQFNDKIEIVADSYGGHSGRRVMGCILNKIGGPSDVKGRLGADLLDDHQEMKSLATVKTYRHCQCFQNPFP